MIAELLYNLTDLINTSFKEGSIPMDWRDCILSVLTKPNKDYRTPKGYSKTSIANTLV